MKFISRSIVAIALSLPALTSAGTPAPGQLTGVRTFIANIMDFINDIVVPAIFAIAFLVFLWGMFQTFILGGSDEDKQKEGRSLMMYSIAGFVIMVSLWGIVNLVANGFGFNGQDIQNIPDLPAFKK
jgi:hypothetical protein